MALQYRLYGGELAAQLFGAGLSLAARGVIHRGNRVLNKGLSQQRGNSGDDARRYDSVLHHDTRAPKRRDRPASAGRGESDAY